MTPHWLRPWNATLVQEVCPRLVGLGVALGLGLEAQGPTLIMHLWPVIGWS